MRPSTEPAVLQHRSWCRGCGYQTATVDNLYEVYRDAILVEDDWTITWVFEGTASAPLLKALKEAKSKVEFREHAASTSPVTEPTALSTQDDFQLWIFKMDDDLDESFAQLPEHVRRGLDFSPASLDVLEKWLLERYPSVEALLTESEKHVLAARYIGETFRKNAGGHWTIDLDNPKNVFSACQSW